MKYFLSFCFLSTFALIHAQVLEHDTSVKFDFESVNHFTLQTEQDVAYISIQHQGDIEEFDIFLDNENQYAASLAIVDNGVVDYGFGCKSDFPVEITSIATSDNELWAMLTLAGRGEINFDAIGLIENITLPEDEDYYPILFGLNDLDLLKWSYLKCGDNPIQHSYTEEGVFYNAGTFTNGLSYIDPLGVETVLSDSTTNGAYMVKIDELGNIIDSYIFEAESFSFLRAFENVEDEIFLLGHDKISGSKLFTVDFSKDEPEFEKDFPGINIYDFGFTQDDEFYMCGHYNNAGAMTNMELNEKTGAVTTLGEADNIDAFLIRYDDEGLVNWVQKITGDNIDTYTSLELDENDGVYTTGCIQADGIFDQGGESEISFSASGLEDVFVARYNDMGDLSYVNTMGGTGSDIGFDVILRDDVLEVFGVFMDEIDVDFDPESEVVLNDENEDFEFSYFIAQYNIGEVSASDVNYIPDPILSPTLATDYIELKDKNQKITAIYDASGTLVKSVDACRADVRHLPVGMYFAHVYSKTGNKSVKFQVVR